MTPTHITALGAFRLKDSVRLLDRHGDIRSGTPGRILGYFASENPTYVVSFEGETVRILGDVRFEQLVLANDVRASV
jgi:hypothetical protein